MNGVSCLWRFNRVDYAVFAARLQDPCGHLRRLGALTIRVANRVQSAPNRTCRSWKSRHKAQHKPITHLTTSR
jgi:uncharacterized protein (DUF58 family)